MVVAARNPCNKVQLKPLVALTYGRWSRTTDALLTETAEKYLLTHGAMEASAWRIQQVKRRWYKRLSCSLHRGNAMVIWNGFQRGLDKQAGLSGHRGSSFDTDPRTLGVPNLCAGPSRR